MNRTIEISSGTILRAIIILLFLWLVYLVRDILMLVFVSVIIVSAIDPVVDWFQKRKIPRAVTVLLLYIIFFLLFSFIISLMVPTLVNEFKDLSQNFPGLLEKLSVYFKGFQEFVISHSLEQNVSQFFSNLASRVTQATPGIFTQTISLLGGIFSFVIVLSVAFYMAIQEKGVRKSVAAITPVEHREYVLNLVSRVQLKMGRWLQGQLFLMLIIFLLVYAGLAILGVPYALTLALFAGLLEIIPYAGPIISAVPIVLIAFLFNPMTGVLALGLLVLVQQFENHVIVPLINKRTVGLNPVAVIVALLIGAKLAGGIGVIVAVPVATMIAEVVGDLVGKSSGQKTEGLQKSN